MKSSERMWERILLFYKFCQEMSLREDAQIIEHFIKRWDESDYRARRMSYECILNLMREHAVPRYPRTELDLLCTDLKDMCYAAAKAQWDIMGDYLLSHKKAGLNIMDLKHYQEQVYRTATVKIRKAVQEGHYELKRNEETGKIELNDLRKEEEE